VAVVREVEDRAEVARVVSVGAVVARKFESAVVIQQTVQTHVAGRTFY